MERRGSALSFDGSKCSVRWTRSHRMPAGQAADDEESFRCRQNGNIMLDLNMETHATTFVIVPTEPILRCY